MSTGATKFEDYNILLRSGDAHVSRLVLTGWGAYATNTPALRTWSDNGRMWGAITTGDVFELYRRPGLASGDKVCSGTISSNAVTLTAANTSGITGTADIPSFTTGTTHLFDVIVNYCDEADLLTVYPQAGNELDSNGKFEGQNTRFEYLFRDVKRSTLDPLLWGRLRDAVGADEWGRPLLGYISDPRQLARVQALLCASRLMERRVSTASAGVLDYVDGAKMYRKQALEEFNLLEIGVDSDRDDVLDGYQKAQSIVIRRA